MKKSWLGVIVVIFLLMGCYEVNEEIVINEKGTGTYLTKIDMSPMLQMIQSMATEEDLAKNGLNRVLDTTISLKSILDTANDVTPEQKRLFGSGIVNLKLNMKESILKFDVNFPYKNLNDLQSLMSGSGMAGLGKVFKKVFQSKDSTQSQSAMAADDPGVDQLNSVYDVTVNNHTISKKLNKVKFDSLMAKPEITQARQMMGSFEMFYTTSIKLPRPVKKSDNAMLKLSDDKKTVTVKYDLMKIFDTPEKFSYSIEY